MSSGTITHHVGLSMVHDGRNIGLETHGIQQVYYSSQPGCMWVLFELCLSHHNSEDTFSTVSSWCQQKTTPGANRVNTEHLIFAYKILCLSRVILLPLGPVFCTGSPVMYR
jgi:hypothetical protein